MVGIDIAPKLIAYAKKKEEENRQGINYLIGNAIELPFEDNIFDFATAFCSFIEIPEYEIALAEAYRIIKFLAAFDYPTLFLPN